MQKYSLSHKQSNWSITITEVDLLFKIDFICKLNGWKREEILLEKVQA